MPEPCLTLRGDPRFIGLKNMRIRKYLLNSRSWEGPENLISGLEILILGINLFNKIYPKKMEILDEIGIKYDSLSLPEPVKLNTTNMVRTKKNISSRYTPRNVEAKSMLRTKRRNSLSMAPSTILNAV